MNLRKLAFVTIAALSVISFAGVGESIPKENTPEVVEQGQYPAVGKSYQVDFGVMKGRADVISESQLRFTNEDKSMSETIQTRITPLRKNLFMVVWTEQNGAVTVMIQDFSRRVLYTNIVGAPNEARLLQLKGTFREIQKEESEQD